MSSNASQAESYNQVPYPSAAFVQTHPNRLATLATLAGLAPLSVEDCRVLEIGCAMGENLIPLALELPAANLVGIDLATHQIRQASETAQHLGADNVSFQVADLAELPHDFGEFDYIIAHGVYSWAPLPVRKALLELYARHLSPRGIGYISFNTFPGWRRRQAIRDILKYHVAAIPDPGRQAEQALALLEFLQIGIPESNPSYRHQIERVLEGLGEKEYRAGRLLHDLLEEGSEAVWIGDYCQDLATHGLQYLEEADPGDDVSHRLQPELIQHLKSRSSCVGQFQQSLDFLSARTFRQTLVCRDQLRPTPSRSVERLSGMEIAANLTRDSSASPAGSTNATKFKDANGLPLVTRDETLERALTILASRWPNGMEIESLISLATHDSRLQGPRLVARQTVETARSDLAELLLQLFRTGKLELHVRRPDFVAKVSERPQASRWARWQGERGGVVTSLIHTAISLGPLNRLLLCLLDGTRSEAQLVEDLTASAIQHKVPVLENHQPAVGEADIRRVIQKEIHARLQRAAAVALLSA